MSYGDAKCRDCDEWFTYHVDPARPKPRTCPPCRKARAAASNKRGQRNWRYKSKYGVTAEWVDEQIARQHGRCLLCKDEAPLVVDHCHTTGKVRGLICGPCNTMIGYIERAGHEALVRAVRYLDAAKART